MHILKYITVSLASLIIISCAADTGNIKTQTDLDSPQNIEFVSVLDKIDISDAFGGYTPEKGTDPYKFIKKDVHFTLGAVDYTVDEDVIPDVEGPIYKKYIYNFTKNPATFQKWLHRSNKYIYLVKDIFRRMDVPVELAYLPMVESGYNPHAYSRAGAGGMWQFMRGTGKVYGLNDNFWIDERRCYEKATVAAAKHLQDLYNYLDDWYLALAAYNAGYGKILNAIKKYETNDFYLMVRHGYLKRETKEYVPKYLAFRHLIRNYELYGFETPAGEPLFYEKVATSKQLNLFVVAKMLGITYDELQDLNPELNNPLTPPVDEYEIKVPYGRGDDLKKIIEETDARKLLQYKTFYGRKGGSVANYAKIHGISVSALKYFNGLKINTLLRDEPLFIPDWDVYDKQVNMNFASKLNRFNPRVHYVKSGDSFYRIARRYGLSVRKLRAMNPNVNPKRVRIGMNIVISNNGGSGISSYSEKYYSKTDQQAAEDKTTEVKHTSSGRKKIYYKVRSGDNFYIIAKKHKTTSRTLKALNPKINANRIKVGQSIVVGYAYSKSSESQVEFHSVQSGDNYYSIAKKYGISVHKLKELNPGVNPRRLLLGAKIKVSGSATKQRSSSKSFSHKVRYGETLYSLSRKYNVSVASIKKWNGLRSNSIKSGTYLKIYN